MQYVHVRIVGMGCVVAVPVSIVEKVIMHLGWYTSGGYWSEEFASLIQLPGAFIVR